MWLAGSGPASQRSASQTLESEDSLPEAPLTAQAASVSGVPAPLQAQPALLSDDVSLSRLSAQREPSGGAILTQLGPKRQALLPRPTASAAATRKGKRTATAAGEKDLNVSCPKPPDRASAISACIAVTKTAPKQVAAVARSRPVWQPS